MHDGRGTGIVVRSYKDKSYIFTAAHVITIQPHSHRQWFRCKTTVQKLKDVATNDNAYVARVVAIDEHRDLAVIEVDGDLGLNTEVELNPFTGEDIWAVGYPMQMASRGSIIISVTKGTLATRNVPVAGNAQRNGYYHRITSQVYFGNSGGGVWTKEGKLLGIVVALYAGNKRVPYEGYYYAKPVNEVLDLLLKRHKYNKVFRK
jgi:S1-C subfamily serine protease